MGVLKKGSVLVLVINVTIGSFHLNSNKVLRFLKCFPYKHVHMLRIRVKSRWSFSHMRKRDLITFYSIILFAIQK